MVHSKGLSSRPFKQMMVGNSKGCAMITWRMQTLRIRQAESLKFSTCIVFAPSTGTKRRLGVVERFNRTFREKYVICTKNMKKLKQTAYFRDAIPQILEEYNFIDDHRSIKELMARYKEKGKHFFTAEKQDSAKDPIHMLMQGKEGQFMKWKEEQTKKVDSIQKDRIDVLKKGGVKNVQYFKGLFSSTK